MPNDQILIRKLALSTRIGVSNEERSQPQRLSASLILEPLQGFRDLADDLARTIDYAAVCAELQSFVSSRQDNLLETLANAIAEHLLGTFPLRRIEIELRKFILPETRYVAVRIARERL
jgi:dihydroneopterin aldolase